MMPPSIGPKIPDVPTTPPATAPIHFFIERGKISGNRTMAREYSPEPPIPWIHLRAISWLIDRAKPQPIEAEKKSTKATM